MGAVFEDPEPSIDSFLAREIQSYTLRTADGQEIIITPGQYIYFAHERTDDPADPRENAQGGAYWYRIQAQAGYVESELVDNICGVTYFEKIRCYLFICTLVGVSGRYGSYTEETLSLADKPLARTLLTDKHIARAILESRHRLETGQK